MEDLKHIIESLLFVAEGPLTIEDIKKALFSAETTEIREALTALEHDYETRKGGFSLNEVAGGYQLRTRPEYNEYIKRLLQPKPLRMSKAALETLAIVAYKQPVIRSDIEHIRGVDSGGILRMLLDRKLIRILGRRTIPGRPLIYGTTKLFLEVFDLKDLKELPTPKEIEALEDEAAANEAGSEYVPDPNQRLLFESEEVFETETAGDEDTTEIQDDVNKAGIETEAELEPSEDDMDSDLDEDESTGFSEAEESENPYTQALETETDEYDNDLNDDEDLNIEPEDDDDILEDDDDDEDDEDNF
jgi:segregation and condensation protein B